MFTATEAIVLQMYPYKDKSAVVKLYSRHLGLVSCWVNSIHSKKSKTKAAVLQPFSIITAEISHRETNNLFQLKEIGLAIPTHYIHTSIEKTTIAIFLSELLIHCIKEASPDQFLYQFVRESICLLDSTTEKCGNFHLLFMVRLCEQLGFLPADRYSPEKQYFNLSDSIYQEEPPRHPDFLEPDNGKLLSELTALPMEQFSEPVIAASMRKSLVNRLLEYYMMHTGMPPLKSHLVLEAL